MKKIYTITLAAMICLSPITMFAKGSSGGGRSFSSSRSLTSSVSKSSTTSRTTTTKTPTTPKVTTPKVSIKPSTTTAKVTSPTVKTAGGKSFGKTGSVVDATYQPRFSGGYTAPIGSTVYYNDAGSSLMNWLPFYMIMTNQSHQEALVVEPAKDGQPAKETVVKEEGLDGMYIWNWIFSILFSIGGIALIVYFVNKKTNKKYA